MHEVSQPAFAEPMLATLHDRAFTDPDWLFEAKLDGVRAVASKRGSDVRLTSRNGKPLERTYPEVVEALGAQAGDFVVDGEVVAFDGAVTSFARLQGRMQIADPERARRTGIAVFYYVFDLLHADGHDVTALPLRRRKAMLHELLDFRDPLRFSTHREEDGERLYEEACTAGWEGLVAKRAASPYRHGRSRDWLKLKCSRRQEMVVGGWTDPSGTRTALGALLVGFYDGDDLVYAGKVGTGFDERTLRELRDRLGERERPTPPFTRGSVPTKGSHWVEPELVAEVAFSEWTRDDRLRHPRYLGLRTDKRPRDVVKEQPA